MGSTVIFFNLLFIQLSKA